MKLELVNINKSFSGKHILHDVNFSIESGRAMGFLGRNGSGKTTTIRTLMDVFKPDFGEFIIDGKKFIRENYKIGYLPEERGLYGKIKIIDQLAYLGELKRMSSKEAKKSAEYWVDYMGLSEYGNKNLETLSKGNQQKIQIIQAVIDDPDIVILDEPFSGLDPVNSQIFKDLIKELIAKNKLVIFSSHQMGYVEEFCDDITFIKNGRIIETGDLNVLKNKLGENKIRLNIKNLGPDQLERSLNENKNINISYDDKSAIIELIGNYKPMELLQDILNKDYEIDLYTKYTPSLEDIFIKLDKEYNFDNEGGNN
ncbi:ABC transporter ATP-binding protein [Miniphocaeibacter halophilus]|uniref:ATP-binding cassette domain-containing protein n=1 Tax=Miniphocaeibacter halophilus TaxID=2931922 RepID=A0AC61MX57_9FIRM|nr:ATP-binding cassette domain-containing protein [Miniphocaeibacter halophilus]QQK08565.1 ATP-binding cassette domain-containing protein [Miniphocaeibacter halophilus]